MKRILSVCTLLVLASAAVACGGNNAVAGPSMTSVKPSAPEPKPADAKKGPVKEPGDANVGDTTRCPVSGDEFTVEANSPKVEHAGKTYYFCCGGCKKKFEADPEKYLKKS
jgi:Cu+-exporting ATPase